MSQSHSSVLMLLGTETLWCSWVGTLFPAYIRAAQQERSVIKTGFQKDLLLKYSWDPTNG